MQHVDDGVLHAWLDGEVGDAVEAAWIEAHLGGCVACRARLAGERATRERAGSLLASIAPAADRDRPAFDALVARARSSETGRAGAGSPEGRRSWVIAAGWAASVALAVAIGWAAHDLWSARGPVSQGDAARQGPAPIETLGPTPVAQPPPVAPATPSAAGSETGELPRRAESRLDAERPAGAVETGDPASAQAAASPPARDAAPGVRPGRAGEAPPPAQPVPEPPPAGEVRTQTGTLAESAPGTPPAGRLGGGAGGRGSGGRGRAPGSGAGGAVPVPEPPPPAPPAAAPPPPQPGRAPAGQALAQVPGFAGVNPVDDIWRALPRTEAAARSGMPLYGIDGLSPTVTTMTADATVVRTVYRLESGETVEVLQRRAGGTGPLFRTGTASATPAWSAVRGDLELTVIGAGPETIAERLRID